MKILKLVAFAIFITVVTVGCNKNKNESLQLQPDIVNEVTVTKGVVTFATMQNYLLVAENKNNEQSKLEQKLEVANFISLNTKPEVSSGSTNSNNIIPTISNTKFNPELYSDYLLSTLNTDKIISVNGFFVKVDMDNMFCSAIDAALPNAYADLRSNSFDRNINIMTFLHPDEPVVEVLNRIRNKELTWTQYQAELSKKGPGGQGICLKRGALEAQQSKVYSNFIGGTLPGGEIVVSARYVKNFLHFALDCQAWVRQNYVNPNIIICTSSVLMNYSFEWQGVCANSGIGNEWKDNRGEGAACQKVSAVVYSGGSALKLRKLIVNAYAKKGAYSNNLIDYLWRTNNYGNTPVTIGY
jgi:hypothetical protein